MWIVNCEVWSVECTEPVYTAQGGGGSFEIGNIQERLVSVNDGSQSEGTDGLTSSWRQRSGVVVEVVIVVVMSLYLEW